MKNKEEIIIVNGGDGSLLNAHHKYPIKTILLPIRDSELCDKHKSKDFAKIINSKHILHLVDKKDISIFNLLTSSLDIEPALSEYVIKNDISNEALRYTIKVYDKIGNLIYSDYVISDGIIIATKLGSTGYFKSITNTIFNTTNNIGVAHICSTTHKSHLILDENSFIEININRGIPYIVCDNIELKTYILNNTNITFRLNEKLKRKVYCYKEFMCKDCIKLRNEYKEKNIIKRINK